MDSADVEQAMDEVTIAEELRAGAWLEQLPGGDELLAELDQVLRGSEPTDLPEEKLLSVELSGSRGAQLMQYGVIPVAVHSAVDGVSACIETGLQNGGITQDDLEGFFLRGEDPQVQLVSSASSSPLSELLQFSIFQNVECEVLEKENVDAFVQSVLKWLRSRFADGTIGGE
ncbi:MAG: hypothetical protein QF741_04490 [Candidatus Peribacteraceae bacterium]|nr:hypothetical protein [Candidatus Peribacteraceae bacterium]MDP7454822.1 hypothetical protein [Candidatus Peribacteraceae bacterium]MDP7645902.1 hypothetical protein [Candidatus Peribacteraceae bacterium]